MAIKRIKNNDTIDHIWGGTTVPYGTYTTIPATDQQIWKTDSTLLQAISAGLAIVNDGTNDFLNASDGINYLMDLGSAPLDSDNSPLYRPKYAPSGWTYQNQSFELQTAVLNSIYAKKPDGTDYGYATMKFYDANNALLTTQVDITASCVKTVVDWEPTYDYEVIGGHIRTQDVATSDVRLDVIGVPDVPAQNGGSKVMISGLNLKYFAAPGDMAIDGRSSKHMIYNATYHSNKLRFQFTHPAGFQYKIFIGIEHFRQ